eukprot:scaffold4587_cov89-Isochrysis_galbana.AAC.2
MSEEVTTWASHALAPADLHMARRDAKSMDLPVRLRAARSMSPPFRRRSTFTGEPARLTDMRHRLWVNLYGLGPAHTSLSCYS